MKRLEKGESYYFISVHYWKVCATKDEHFTTDDNRFSDGNYFPDAYKAHDCFEKIDDAYGEAIEKIESRTKKAKKDYLAAVNNTIKKWKAYKAEKHKTRTPEDILDDVVKANDQYHDALNLAQKELRGIHEKIDRIIKAADKF